jgi:hypothetical protein
MNDNIRTIYDNWPILKDYNGFNKNEIISLNKEYNSFPGKLNEFWFFRRNMKELYFTNSEIAKCSHHSET